MPPPSKKTSTEKFIKYHNDGTVWARGQTVDGKPNEYFEWFRKEGVIMRSGYFNKGKQMGEWTTYDKKRKVLKVTKIKN